MKLGLSTYTYTWAIGVPGSFPPEPMSAFDLIDKAFSAGLNLVQIADNLPLENWQIVQLEELYSYACKKNVSIEMGSRGLTTEHTIKCLETAKILHSPILRMIIDKTGFEPDLTTIISVIRELLPEFEACKIKLAIENHDRFKAFEFEKIIHSVGSEWVGICLDSVNSMGAGEGFETVCDILIPYTFNLHVKDFRIFRVSHKMGMVIEGSPAGKGMLNIPDLVKRIDGLGLCKSGILELWTPPEESIQQTLVKESEWASESIMYLKSIF